jgi:hypothetical protein
LQLPTPDKLKTVADKVKDFFGDVKESFGEITSLVTATDESEEDSKEKTKWILCLLDATYLIEVSMIVMNVIQLHGR